MSTGRLIARFIVVLVIMIAATTPVVLWSINQPGAASATAVTVVAIAGIIGLMIAVFHLLWRPMLADFPAREPAPDAVRRHFQSFGLGIVNMGFSIHVAVDDAYLHLMPLAIWQSLGARPASIPWSAMEPIGNSGRVVRVAGHRLDGPRWCMSLAGSRDGGADQEDGGSV